MRFIEKVWFNQHWAKWLIIILLLPLTLLFWGVTSIRRVLYQLNVFTSFKVKVPVIVVGNIGIGGNGKTPLVIYLVEACLKLNIKVGVITRGYGGEAPFYPYLVSEKTTAKEAGDEAVLIFNRCQIPVMVGSDRVASAQALIDLGCELLLTDDGLQHYRLAREKEIIVVDHKRHFGNGFLLPSGPLREGLWRLKTVDKVIYNISTHGAENISNNSDDYIAMSLAIDKVCNIKTGEIISLKDFLKNFPQVNALAGIGDPTRFFNTLINSGFALNKAQGFNDHHDFSAEDFLLMGDKYPLLMTEKDAVKCLGFSESHWWYIPVSATFNQADKNSLLNMLTSTVKSD